jgi:hypothetical protein
MRFTLSRGSGGLGAEGRTLLPWAAAALVWFGLVLPMRADQGTRLSEQSRVRRERLTSERAQREFRALTTRVDTALAAACRASTDPAVLRQEVIEATAGLDLSSFTLSVTGGSSGGAVVEAAGSRRTALQLLSRLGDPARGGFLRTATIRDRGGRTSLSAATGVLAVVPAGRTPAPCSNRASVVEPAPELPETAPSPKVRAPVQPRPRATPLEPPPLPTPELQEAPPFTVVGFLSTGGKGRVSVRMGDEIRVLSVGDQFAGWTCVSIDRDLGAVFTSSSGARVVLVAMPSGD